MSRRVVDWWFRKKRTGPPPAQPAPPVPSNETGNGVTLGWTFLIEATLYTLERATVQEGPYTTVTQTTTDLSYDDSGLTPSTLYYYRLKVNNRYGESVPSEVSIVTLDTVTPPAAPTTAPTETQHGTTTASWTWTTVATATGYELHRATSSGGTYTKVYDGTAVTFNDSGLTAATTYYYKYLAKNADGSSGFSPIANVTTDGVVTVPAVPGQPTASNVGSTSADLSVAAVTGATDYEWQRRSTAPTVTAFATVHGPGPDRTWTQVGLSASTTYEFKVRASNSAGASAYSVVRIVTTGSVSGTNVQPLSAMYVRERIGVADHPNFNGSTSMYRVSGADERIGRLAAAGVGFIRGGLGPVADQYATILRQHDMKWCMGVTEEGGNVPTDNTLAQTRANVREIRENYADVCLAIEGVNEPNQNRSGGAVVANWAQITVDHQKAIWQEAKWNLTSVNGPIGSSATAGSVLNPLRNVMVIGPGMHDVATENSYTQTSPSGGKFHWQQLIDQGILNNQDRANVHSYAGGDVPQGVGYVPSNPTSGKMQQARLKYMYQEYGVGYPCFITEWGWHNAIATTAGHEPASESAAGTYGIRGYLQIAGKAEPNGTDYGGIYLTHYETIDDFDGGTKDTHESNFGVIGYTAPDAAAALLPANWRNKPILTKVGVLANALKDPAGTQPYTPNRVFFTATTGASGAYLQWSVTATKAQSNAGTATAWIWRDMPVWNRSTRTAIAVSPITVTVTDRVGARTFQVDAEVSKVDLR